MAAPSSTLQRLALKSPFSTQDAETIQRELKAILASSHFRNSRRYPVFLTYIVETALQGKAEEIKERNIGVEAFGRAPDYDTNLDPIVRNTAGEVRKRLILYYAENSLPHGHLEISLLPGNYIPEFYLVNPHAPADNALRLSQLEEGAPGIFHPALTPEHTPAIAGTQHAEPTGSQADAQPTYRNRSLVLWGVLALAMVSLAAVGYGWWKTRTAQALWSDFFSSRYEVLIIVPQVPFPQGNAPATWVRDNPDIALEDLSAIMSPAGVLMEHRVPYNVKLDPAVSLEDMTNRPVILIGGPTNKWTMTLTESLRYRMKKDAQSLKIEDSQQGSSPVCTYETAADGSVVNDCAIIARFYSSLTANTVMVIAGTGRNGTKAAGEWITSPGLDATLSKLFPHGWKNRNIEIVLKTSVIEGKNSAPAVARVFSW